MDPHHTHSSTRTDTTGVVDKSRRVVVTPGESSESIGRSENSTRDTTAPPGTSDSTPLLSEALRDIAGFQYGEELGDDPYGEELGDDVSKLSQTSKKPLKTIRRIDRGSAMSTTQLMENVSDIDWKPGESTPLLSNGGKKTPAVKMVSLPKLPSPSSPSWTANVDANGNVIKKKKKRGLRLTKDSVSKLQRRVRRTMLKHDLSANFYSYRQFYFFTLIQALLGLSASFLALATENSTVAGFLSAFAVLVQTISENCEYATKAAMHQNVALEMGSLREELGYLKDKLDLAKDLGLEEMELEDMFDDDSDDDDDQKNYDFDSIHNRINHALGLCKSNVPLKINDAFLAIESDLKLSRAQKLIVRAKEKRTKGYKKAYREYQNYIHLKAFDQLNAAITNHYFFPLFLPDSEDVVKIVMANINERCKPTEGQTKTTQRPIGNRKSSYFGDIENLVEDDLSFHSEE